MTDLKTYDPSKVNLIVGGFQITGFAQGTMIELTPAADWFNDDFGVDGEPARWANANPYNDLRIYLMHTSNSNLILSNLHNADRLSQVGVVPVYLEDDSREGGLLEKARYVSARGWIKAPAAVQFGSGPGVRQWNFRLLETLYHTPGTLSTPASAQN